MMLSSLARSLLRARNEFPSGDLVGFHALETLRDARKTIGEHLYWVRLVFIRLVIAI